jgi:16S rRNA (guanine966-N2)-methyltransferase
MRVIGGRYRGRRLVAPRDRVVRPTGDRVREALFNRLDHAGWGRDGASLIVGARVADVFAGTGALGIEALSRGAAHVVFLDHDPAAIAAIRRNLGGLEGAAAATSLVIGDALAPPPAAAPCDVILMDPPYGSDLALPALHALKARGWIAGGAHIIVEGAAKDSFAAPPGFTTIDSRRYGSARLVFLRSA